MDEYTPTTEQVRAMFEYGCGEALTGIGDGNPRSEFDRWLAERDRGVAANAWDEGYQFADEDGFWYDRGRDRNPYRNGGKNV